MTIQTNRRSGLPAAIFRIGPSRPGGRSYGRKIVAFLTVMVMGPLAAVHADDRLERSRAIALEFQQRLGAEMQAALNAGGPVAAVHVCAEVAPAIAARASAEGGAAVSRTALRVRNPVNAPDADAEAALTSFSARVAAGDAMPVEHFAPGPEGGMRYMRAILLQPLCVGCHGESIAPQIAAAIAQQYPEDRATGFRVGDLRGAFLIDWPDGGEVPE